MGGPISNSLIPFTGCVFCGLAKRQGRGQLAGYRLMAIPRTRGVPLRDLPQLFSSDLL
jgi:hypothetical protein